MRKQAIMIAGITGLAGLGVVLVLRMMVPQDASATGLLRWQDAAVVARGHALYARDCAGCHGALDGRATTDPDARPPDAPPPDAPPHDARGHTWEHPDYALFQLTKSGEVAELCRTLDRGGMPQFGAAMSDQEIVAVLSYIKSTWPDELRAKQESVNALYAAQNAAHRELIHR
ncbi:c-type cytochrome [Roseovarius sp. C7]|uniref:c-type cytochrome n=1 Tax=Roseovarius sp. C7 TaxID=3398643 RepID=UPI0039F58858